MIRRIVFFAVVACAAAASLQRLVELVGQARELGPLPYEARRERVVGPFYASAKALKGNEPLALITPAGGSADAAIFANYYLYPRRTTIFRNIDDYRANSGNPQRPAAIVRAGNVLERTTYAAMRDEVLHAQGPIAKSIATSPPLQTFAVPLAASVDGPPPDRYTIEGSIRSGDAPSRVTISFQPSGRTATIDLAAHAQRDFYDVVYQLFGVMEQGWLLVNATQPVSAGFVFVNRALGEVEPLPLVTRPAQVATQPAAKVWTIDLAPPNRRLYTFLSFREKGGRTRFVWP